MPMIKTAALRFGTGRTRHLTAVALVLGLTMLQGCGRPSQVNVALRKQVQSLESEIDRLQRQNSAAQARIAGLEQRVNTVPTLPQNRLDTMFTVHGIEIGRLTGGDNTDPQRPGDEGVKVYVTPVDEAGDSVKATGRLTVEVYDLDNSTGTRVCRSEFDAEAMKELWRGFGLVHAFVVECPWQTAPRNPMLAVKVTFEDALTGRVFTALKEVKVNLPPPAATQPA